MITIALRTVLCRILEGRTWAAERVFDSPLDPLAEVGRVIDVKQQPCIAVYSQEAKGKPTGLETQGGKQAVKMVVAVYLPPSAIKTPNGTVLEIDNVGSALALDTLGRQVDAAMHFGEKAWVAIWRSFVLNIVEKTSRFVLISIENGVRIPCLEVEYELDCVADAEFATPLYGAWQKLDAQLRIAGPGSEDVKIADHLKKLIEEPAGLHDYEQFQANFALSDEAFATTGLNPVATVEETGDVPTLEGVDAPPEITVEGPGQIP